MNFVMDDMLRAKIGKDEVLRVAFKKTVLMGQYETEVYTADTSIELPAECTGIERVIAEHMLMSQLEYGVSIKLVMKGKMSKEEWEMNTQRNEHQLNLLLDKAQALGVDVYIDKLNNWGIQGE